MTMSNSPVCSLALGTVQFGLNYGITNRTGKPSPDEIGEILSTAANRGISLLDTASGYGDSEKILGQLSEQSRCFSIMTKTPNWNGMPPDDCARSIACAFEASLRHLNRDSLWGVMVHFARDLLSGHGSDIWRGLQAIKAAGKVEKIGISCYADDPIVDLAAKFKPDFVQLPMNVLDQRSLLNGTLQSLHSDGIEIHARSVFLQGILLTSNAQLPSYLRKLSEPLKAFTALCKQSNLSQLEGALSFICSANEISRIIVGVTSALELQAISRAFNAVRPTSIDWRPLHCGDPSLIDPRFWPSS
jgi:aryl-alcohol dehydrogenase-like predicted oxidoreductase